MRQLKISLPIRLPSQVSLGDVHDSSRMRCDVSRSCNLWPEWYPLYNMSREGPNMFNKKEKRKATCQAWTSSSWNVLRVSLSIHLPGRGETSLINSGCVLWISFAQCLPRPHLSDVAGGFPCRTWHHLSRLLPKGAWPTDAWYVGSSARVYAFLMMLYTKA